MRRWLAAVLVVLWAAAAAAQAVPTRVETVTLQPSTTQAAAAVGVRGRSFSGLGWARRWFCVANVTALTATSITIAIQASPDAQVGGTTFTDFLSTQAIAAPAAVVAYVDTSQLTGSAGFVASTDLTVGKANPLICDSGRVTWTQVGAGAATFSVICTVGS